MPCEHTMSDTGPLFVSSGDIIADRRYKWAIDQAARSDFVAAADILAQTVELAPDFATAWFALGAIRDRLAIAPAPLRLSQRPATPTLTTITVPACSLRALGQERRRPP
jgi:hypothetical protein